MKGKNKLKGSRIYIDDYLIVTTTNIAKADVNENKDNDSRGGEEETGEEQTGKQSN